MFSIPQSTSFVFVFKAYLSSDHVTEATGKTIAITISKNGGAFGNPNAGATNATEISSGWYKVTLDTTDTNTTGILAIRGAVATIDDVGDRLFVVKATNGGLTALPDTACTTNASLITSGTSTAQLSVSSGQVDLGKILGTTVSTPATAGVLDVNVKNIDNDAASASGTVTFPNATLASTTNITAGTIATVTNVTTVNGLAAGVITTTSIADNAITDAKVASDVTIASVTGAVGSVTGAVGSVTGLTASNLDATVSSRLASSSYTAPLDAAGVRTAVGLASANLDTQLDALPTNAELSTSLGTADDATLSAIAALSIPTASEIRIEMDSNSTKLAHLDADITSRMATFIYTAPANSDITAIKAVTDGLPVFVHTGGKVWALDGDGNSLASAASVAALPTTSTVMQANIKKVNDIDVTGDGDGTPWGP